MFVKIPFSHNLSILICTVLLTSLVVSDCPISYYPESTFIGSIKANIDNSMAQVKQQQFTYNLIQSLTTNVPSVAIMISSFNYRPQGSINFNIFYKPSPSFSQLLFLVNVTEQGKNKWQWIQFSFFASQNKIFEIGSQFIRNITNTQNDQRKLIVSKLPLNNIYQKPIVKVFLNGLNLYTNVSKEQVNQIRSQVQGYRALTWSSSVVKYLQKKIIERQTLQAQISSIVLENMTISYFVDLGYKQSIEFISFSYVIFTSYQQTYQNEFIEGRFALNSSIQVSKPALNHMDLLFIGLQGIKFKQWQFLSLNPTLITSQLDQKFSLKNTFSISTQNEFGMAYFAISKTINNYCSHCRDGNVVYDNFCVTQCPQSHVKKYSQNGEFCEFCDIKQFKVLNKEKTQCVCAMQYFNVVIKDSKQFTCSACNYQCLTCESEYKCLTCDNRYLKTFRVLDNVNSQCMCASGYYDDGQRNIKCLKCHEQCLTCKGPSQFDCETCTKGKIRGIDGNCICDGNFVEKNGTCVCESPNFNYKGYCFIFLSKSKCSQNEIQVIINGTKTCQCKPNYLRFKTICILCGDNQKVDQQTGKCVCRQSYYKDEHKNVCVGCTNGKVYNKQLNKCICAKKTFQTTDGRCITCKRRQTLINNQCQCIYNYFRNNWGQCERCETSSSKPQCKINKK